jgi:hypothetical protein
MNRELKVHKANELGKLSQPICGAFLTPLDIDHYLSVHDENVNCSACLQMLKEKTHVRDDGRLVF